MKFLGRIRERINSKKKKGFTLIEVLVVIAIIGILARIVLTNALGGKEKAEIGKARAEVDQIRKAILILEFDTEEWPGHRTIYDVETGVSGNEVWDLNAPEAGIVATDGNFVGWKGPYMNTMPTDPWGNNYFFDTDYDMGGGTWAAVVGSFGPNGVGPNNYDSDNIVEVLVEE